MTRFAIALMSLMLFLTVWSGAASHAAEAIDCAPIAEQFHDGTEPSKDDSGRSDSHIMHHHGCTSIAVASNDGNQAQVDIAAAKKPGPALDDASLPSAATDAALRPPIA